MTSIFLAGADPIWYDVIDRISILREDFDAALQMAKGMSLCLGEKSAQRNCACDNRRGQDRIGAGGDSPCADAPSRYRRKDCGALHSAGASMGKRPAPGSPVSAAASRLLRRRQARRSRLAPNDLHRSLRPKLPGRSHSPGARPGKARAADLRRMSSLRQPAKPQNL